MSSMFIWGACFGFLFKMAQCRAAQVPFTTRPWQYPKHIIFFAGSFHYLDWYRRMSLENLCKQEEKSELLRLRLKLDSMEIGQENYEPFKNAIYQIAVDTSRI